MERSPTGLLKKGKMRNTGQKRKSDRLNQMTKDIGAGDSFHTFATRILRNWEERPPDDKANKLLRKLANEFNK